MKIVKSDIANYWYDIYKINSIQIHSGFSILLNDMKNQSTKEYRWYKNFLAIYNKEINHEIYKKVTTQNDNSN